MHFIEIRWDNESKKPFLACRDPQDSDETKLIELSSGNDISITITDGRYCVGSYNNEKFKRVPCPRSVKLNDPKRTQCYNCNRSDSGQILSLTALNIDQIENLKKQPHLNYINIFGQDIIKTGVASIHRKFRRILEQASTATIFFADGDGYVARQIENFVSKNLQIRQAVSIEMKLRHINNHILSEGARKVLEQIFENIKSSIDDRFKSYIREKPEFYYNTPFYQLNLPENMQTLMLASSFNVGDVVTGKIAGIFGGLLILENDSKFYAINTHDIEGYIIGYENLNKKMKLQNEPKNFELYKPPIENFSLF